MTDNNNLPAEIRGNAVDYVTAGAKAVLGMVPFAGSLLAEIAGSVIPKQRVDRIADFAARLEARLSHLERDRVSEAVTDEEFTDLTEEALRQASRATTLERREYLARLLASSLSPEAISYSETKHLMRLLGELNDVEVIWLRFFAVPTFGGDEEFRELHADVLEPRHAYIGSSTKEAEAGAIQESYTEHLVRLGLVDEQIQKDREGKPEFDRFSGDFKVSYRHTSTLGSLLLRHIGLAPPEREQ
ncbi:MAG: hypothetical protein A2Z90_20400 [Burkholderiales bacterium GWA2_64_37]|nr:MAG: hypothetical protein A2Z90_20400 [Burkholderiales bacterium GWA2_64_37]HCE91634.1 hypothetical protein [Acidovorax sp.]